MQARRSRSHTVALGVLLALVALAGLTLVVIADGGPADDSDAPPDTDDVAAPSTTAASTVAPATSAPPQSGEVDVEVYFVRDELVVSTGRTVASPAVARGAIEALLEGPSAAEVGEGMATAVPAGTQLLAVDITDGIATIDLSGTFASGGGSLSMQLRVAQVVFTVTQFDSVDTVTIELDGQAVEAIGGEGVDATDLTRADFPSMAPAG